MDTIVDFLLNFYGPTPYFMIFGMLLLCGFGLPIPEDVTIFAAGLLVYYGVCNFWIMLLVCMAGVMVGDSIMWWLGNKYGRRLSKKWWFQKFISEDRIQEASHKLNKKSGGKILFAARFMPGLRAPMFFTSGFLHVPFWRFFIWDGLAAVLSVPAILGAVYYWGDQIDQVVRWIKRAEYGIIGVIVLFIIVAVFKSLVKKKCDKTSENSP